MRIGGILGYDFASRFVIRVDYDTKTIDLHEPGDWKDPAGAERVPFRLETGHPHVRGTVTIPDAAPIPADFILDSGAAETANLTSPFVKANRLLERARRTPAGEPNKTPGSETQFFAQTSMRGKLAGIQLAGVALHDIPVNLQLGTKGAYSRASFSGTIGQGILKRFTTVYDYSRSVLVLVPNAAFDTPFPPRRTFGATFVSKGPEFTVFEVSGIRKGSPAEAAGLQKGDVVDSLDTQPAAALRLVELRAALLDEGSQHVLSITRGASSQKLRIPITIKLVSIEE